MRNDNKFDAGRVNFILCQYFPELLQFLWPTGVNHYDIFAND